MLNDTTSFKKVYIATGYTDYLRSIIIREDCCNPLQLQHFLIIFTLIILEVLLFEKIAVTHYSYSIF